MRVRDLLYTRAFVVDTARPALVRTVGAIARSPELLLRAGRTLELLIDTFPLSAMVDGAREAWRRGPNPAALPVLERAAEVASAVVGWPPSVDRRWPLPGEADLRGLAGPGPHVVLRRGENDGAPAVAVALDAPLGPQAPWPTLPVESVPGDEIAARLPDLLDKVRSGELAAVRATSPVPHDDESRRALEVLREASSAQAALERYGWAGLAAGRAVAFEDLLSRAPPQRLGRTLIRCCSALVLPRISATGRVEATGVLVWEEAWRPVRVLPAVATLLSALDEPRTAAEVSRKVGLGSAELEPLLEQLAELGAIRTAA